MDVNQIGFREFASYDEADRFYGVLDAQGYEYISTLCNVPRPGMFTVRWGHLVAPENGHQYEMRVIAQVFREREQEAADEFNAECTAHGRRAAAEEIAAARGLIGRDAELFADGFCGVAAKWANPRKEGREPIFREGRRAWGGADGQRLARAKAVAARSILAPSAPRPFNPGHGLIANGEH